MHNLTFGARLRQMREESGISRRDLGARVKLAPTYLEKIERGYNAPPSNLAIADIAKALKVDGDELFALAGKLAPDLERAIRSKPLVMLAARLGNEDERCRFTGVLGRFWRGVGEVGVSGRDGHDER